MTYLIKIGQVVSKEMSKEVISTFSNGSHIWRLSDLLDEHFGSNRPSHFIGGDFSISVQTDRWQFLNDGKGSHTLQVRWA